MTPAEVMVATAAAGFALEVDDEGQLVIMVDRPGGRLNPQIKAAVRDHRDRLAAVLKLRSVHRSLGLSEEDISFVERALLTGAVSEIRIVAQPCPEEPV